MMATTHVLVEMALAALLPVGPELSTVALVAAASGGFFPDLDLYAGHRRTLHFPVYYSAVAVPALGVALAVGNPVTVALGSFLLAAAAHSAMDAFGGGLELKPWLGESDRAVYDHARGRWIAPRRWIPYDGAPEDFVVAALVGLPLLSVTAGPLGAFVVGVIGVSALYALLRKPLVRIAELLVERLPAEVVVHVPERFLEGVPPQAGHTRYRSSVVTLSRPSREACGRSRDDVRPTSQSASREESP